MMKDNLEVLILDIWRKTRSRIEEDRLDQIKKEKDLIFNEMNRRGIFRSGMTIQRIEEFLFKQMRTEIEENLCELETLCVENNYLPNDEIKTTIEAELLKKYEPKRFDKWIRNLFPPIFNADFDQRERLTLTNASKKLNSAKRDIEAFWTKISIKTSQNNKLSHPKNQVHADFIDPGRIEELKAITTKKFDLSKLIRLCEELNIARENNCYISIIMLTRAIIDHIPPIFSFKSFSDLANQHPSSRSFKDSMLHLDNSSRKIADAHLHTQIRNKEILPRFTQVNFSADLDVLLSEIVRILK